MSGNKNTKPNKDHEFCNPAECKGVAHFDSLIIAVSELIQRSEFDKAYAEIVAFVSSPEYRTVMAPVFAYDGLKNQLPKNIAAFFTGNPDRHLGAKHGVLTYANVTLLAYFATVACQSIITGRDRALAAAIARADALEAQATILARPEQYRVPEAEISTCREEECRGTVYALIPGTNKTVASACPIKRLGDSDYCKYCSVAQREAQVTRVKRELAEREAEIKKQVEALEAEKRKLAELETAAKKLEADLDKKPTGQSVKGAAPKSILTRKK